MTAAQNISENFSRLKTTEFRLLKGLDDSELHLLAESMTLRSFQPDGPLLKIGDDSTKLFFIVEGSVNVEIPLVGGGAKERIASIGIGHTAGEFSLAREGKVTAHVSAIGEVIALESHRDRLRGILEANPRIGCVVYRNLSRIIIDRLVDTNMLARNVLSQISLL